MAKEVKLHVGINNQLETITTTIPDNDPKPWDGKDELRHIGKHVPRIDGKAKVTGSAKYTFDIQLPGMLQGRFLAAPWSSAKITKIDISKAQKAPGVRAIVLAQEQLPMVIRHAGQEILAIAAETGHQAEEALKLVTMEYKKLPFVVDLEEAITPDSHNVFQEQVKEDNAGDDGQVTLDQGEVTQEGNVRGPRVTPKDVSEADVDTALKSADVMVETKYTTQVQTHSALETHGVVAKWEDDEHLTVWASTQGTFTVRDNFAAAFKLPKANVRVLTEYMGGGFGSKFGAGVYGMMAAKLARQSKAPVKLMYDRKQEHYCGGNRPNSLQYLKAGASKDGKLKALKLNCFGSSGIAAGGANMISWPIKNVYQCDQIYMAESDVFINGSPGAAFRAPGHPQSMFALEQTIDQLAYKLGIDPLEFRRINSQHHKVRLTEYEIGAKNFGWDKRNPKVAADSGPIKHGVGMANAVWYYFYNTGFQAGVQVNSDGSVELTNGVQDIGTGIRTVLAMVVAEELGLEISDVNVMIGDTNFGYGPASGGSQTTAGITPAARNAAYLAKVKMLEIAAPLLETTPDKLSCQGGKIFITDTPEKSLAWKKVASKIPGDKFMVIGERTKDYHAVEPSTIAGVQFVEVEVDTETGVIKVKRVVAVHDCGRPMDRLTLESQINGGIIQGVSYALFEDRILDRNTGVQVNANLEHYKIAGAMDVPDIQTTVIDVNRGSSSTGAMGIGEPATVPMAGAIANAVYHATGVRIYDLPMTPDKVLNALQAAQQRR